MLNLRLSSRSQEISEDSVKHLSIEDCIRLRQEIQTELMRYHQINPGVMSRFLYLINETLMEKNYYLNNVELNEAYG